MNDLLELIRQRRSTRDFSDRPVNEDDLFRIFEAARWAPSSYNGQSWRFIYADKNRDTEFYNILFDLLVPFNQAWAKAAPVLVLTMARIEYEHSGEEYKHSWYDLGLAVGNMIIMAESIGISTHQMAGIDFDRARNELNIPGKFEPVSMIAIGYAEKTGNLPLDIYKMESVSKERKELNEIVFSSKF